MTGPRAPRASADGEVRGLGDVVTRGRRDLEQLIGRRVESVSAVRKCDDGWTVLFEVLELERVPDSTSVLGSYETSLDDRGALLGYERCRRYHRNQVSEAES